MYTTREIDKIAQNIFNDSLPPGWLIRKQDPDIHVDYFVEIDEKSRPSGVVFGVQLKGTNSPRYSNDLIKISIETKHLSYYLDNVKQPIFLIVVDTKKKQGFWFFLQKWAKEELQERNWRKQENIDIIIPLRNSLSDVKFLHAEVEDAEIFMRDLWPSSIPAAIQHKKKSLEGLDHRLQVDISYQGGGTRCRLQAREPFSFNIKFRENPNIKDKFADLINRGKAVTFDANEIIEVGGSPLIESIFEESGKGSRKGKLSIEPERRVQTVLLLSTIDVAEQEKIVLYGVEGVMCTGKKEARFQGELKETPLKVELSFPLPPSIGGNPLKVVFNIDSSGWQNIPVRSLPHFEKLKTFFTSIQEGCVLRIVCEIKGNHIFTATSQANINLNFELTLGQLQLLEKIRTIATEMNINPIYPKNGFVSKDEIKTIYLLHDLIRCGEYRENANGLKFIGKLMPTDNFFEMIQGKDVKDISGSLVFEPVDRRFTILGEEFEFHPLRYTLTNPILTTDISQITRDNAKIHMEGIDIPWSGGPSSELIISKGRSSGSNLD